MKALFNLTDRIKQELTSNPLINDITLGNILDVDLDKQTVFPMAHVSITNGSISSSTATVNVSILFMDIVDETPEATVDKYYGNDNEHFVLNSMLSAASQVVQNLMRGDMYSDGFQVEDDATVEFFSERFENKLAGVGIDFSVVINNNVELC